MIVSNSIGRKNLIAINPAKYARTSDVLTVILISNESDGKNLLALMIIPATRIILPILPHSYRIGSRRLVNANVRVAINRYALAEATAEPIPPMEGTR